ncbi:MAG: ATP-grasp domain-containing protein [Candidatus Pacearchaeota archaeon]
MKKVKWLIEENCWGAETTARLAKVFQKLGISYKLCKYIPFSTKREDIELPINPQSEDCVIFYGSINFAQFLSKTTNWYPLMFDHFETFETTTYYPIFHKLLLNTPYIILPFGDFENQKDFIFETFKDEALFIRPVSGKKSFTGQTMAKHNFEDQIKWFKECHIPDPSTLCLISKARKGVGYKEYRAVVIDGKVLSISQYYRVRYIPKSNELHEIVQQLVYKIKRKEQPSAYTLDICFHEGEYKIVEINSFNCAGWYHANLYPIIEHATALAQKQYNLIYQI